MAHSQRKFPRRMYGQVVDGLLVGPEGLEEDERVGIVDTHRPISGCGDEVARKGEMRRREEGEGGDGSRVIVE